MKKVTLLMTLLVAMVTTTVAQEAPVAGKFYVFNSAYDGFVAYEKGDNKISCNNYAEGDSTQIWYLEAVNNDERVRVRNLSTGRYMVDNGQSKHWNTVVYASDASLFYIVTTSNGHTLNIDNNTTTYTAMHCDGSKNVVGWVAGEINTYSHWTFTEVSVETASLGDVASALSTIGVKELELTTEEGQANRIWANKPYTGSNAGDAVGGVAALLDDNKNTYLHTDYDDPGNTTEGFHCLYVDLGDGSQATHFAFDYITRADGNTDYPNSITVQGCETETGEYVDLYTISNLPQSKSAYTVSDVFGSETAYRYLRFKVEANKKFFHMAEFNLYTVDSDYAYKSAVFKNFIEEIQYQPAKINAEYTGSEAWIDKSLYSSFSYALTVREYPFTLTTDVNNPVCYAIKSARTTVWSDGDYYWTFVPYEGKLTIFPGITKDSNDYEKDIFKYWFFMENEEGKLMFIPFVDKENPMGYKTVTNAQDKMTNDNTVSDYAGNTYTLAHEDYADGYSWAFQPFGTDNYVSNNGGNWDTPKMGFWNGDGFGDAGGRVCFVEIENKPVAALADLYMEIKADSEAAATTYPVGTAVGQYTQDSYDAYVATINEQKSVVAGDATAEDVATACTTARTNIQNAKSALQINMPVAGRFYRIRDNANNYILNDGTTYTHNSVAKITMASGKATAPESVYYYDGKSLLAYKCGKYISTEVNRYAEVGATGSLTIVPSSTPCYFNIKKNSDGTSMHSSRTYTDRCSSVCGTAHDFAFEEVTWLPVKISNTFGVATFYSPVALYTNENKVKAYAAKMSEDGTYVSLVEVNQDDRIPANTPVYLTYVEGSEQDNGHSYIHIDYDYTEEYQGENEFKGTLPTVTTDSKSGEGTIYSLKNGANGVGFYIHGNADLSGFKAYLPVAMAGAAQSIEVRFDGATSIDEVVTEEGSANAAIYDLTGRRVEKAEKGIYIVNGKKILVK